MKDFITHSLLRFNISSKLMFLSLVTSIILSGCKEDDIPPVSAFVEPPPLEQCALTEVDPTIGGTVTDFECETPTFGVFGNVNADYTVAVVDNPVSGGINTSDRVVEVVQSAGVEGWSGFFFDLSAKVDFSANRTIKIKVYSPAVDHVVLLKLEDQADAGVNKEISTLTTVAGEWEELSFIFKPTDDNLYDRAVLFFNFNGDKDSETIHYFDDIEVVFGDAEAVLAPPTAVEDPFLPADEVFSVYSDAYTPITVSELPTPWSSSDFEVIDIEGNNVIKAENLDFMGIALDYGSPTDLSGKSYLHIDYWTPDATSLELKLVNTVLSEEDVVSLGTIAQEEWVSVDILLDDFVMDRTGVTQIILDNLDAAGVTVYIDNLYFHEGFPTEPGVPAGYPNPTDVISIYSDQYTPITVSSFPAVWSGSGYSEIQINGTDNVAQFSNLDFVGIELDYGNPTDLTDMTHVHFDYWTTDAKALGIKLVNTVVGEEDIVDVGTIVKGQWVSVDIPLDNFDFDRSGVTQILFDNLEAGADITVFLDNLYFYKE